MNPTSTYVETMQRIANFTDALRYFRSLAPESKDPRAEVIIERYINLLSAKARALFTVEEVA